MSGHAHIRFLSPYGFCTRRTGGQNLVRLLTNFNGYAAYYLVKLCYHFSLIKYSAV